MKPTVVWNSRGDRQFYFLLCRLGRGDEYVGVREAVSQWLAEVFPDTATVIVLDLYFGFSDRPDEYTLLVDLRYPTEGAGGTVVVKLAADSRLRFEAEAWARTKEPHFNGDEVLMRQTPVYHPLYRHRLIAVVYQDAATHIGLDLQVSLERAFLGAVRFGSPSVRSVLQTFATLFRSLRRNLYAGGSARDRLTAALELNPDNVDGRRRSLVESVVAWRAEPAVGVVELVESALGIKSEGYLNPLGFFRQVGRELEASRPRFAIPLTRGPAHGDLHGRNVIVGLDDAAADRPAVYDYEHMNRDNLIALDFAKLETELKVRAYPHVFPFDRPMEDLPPREYVDAVYRHEAALLAGGRPAGPARPRRLFALLTGIRRLAAETLGQGDTKRDWRQEYLLLLSAYGVYSVRFGQSPALRTAAFVSAGVAARSVRDRIAA